MIPCFTYEIFYLDVPCGSERSSECEKVIRKCHVCQTVTTDTCDVCFIDIGIPMCQLDQQAQPSDQWTKFLVSFPGSCPPKLSFSLAINPEYVKKTRVIDDVFTCDNTKYSSHTLSEVVDGKNRNECVLITISRTCK